MFVISEMSDSIRVPPWLFRVSPNEAIVEQLNRRLANKVVINVGLCIALYDITKIEDSRILPGDGSFHTTVSMGFFEDILITPDGMQHPTRFDEAEQLWMWLYEADGVEHKMYMDLGEPIRFRVVAEQFVDTTPGGPETTELPDAEERHVPYSLTASISESGLGLLKWWT